MLFLLFPAVFSTGGRELLQMADSEPGRHKFFSGNSQRPDTTPPTVSVTKPKFLPSRTSSQALRAIWLGHACSYIEFPSGLRVLFDPVFEDRCSPFSWLGHKRFTPRPCDISDIPIIDCVSHHPSLVLSIMIADTY